MDFIMPVFDTVKAWQILFLTLAISWLSPSYAAEFTVDYAHINKIGNGYTLNAQIDYPLTPRIKEALSNGVPITFLQQVEITHSLPILGDYWQWDTQLWSTELRYELRYHALTSQYVVRALDTGNYRNFISLDEALSALGNIAPLTLPPKHLTDTDNLVVRIRSGLDLFALPTPMRPGALISKKWQVTSDWAEATWP
jgi:hypothetical protein